MGAFNEDGQDTPAHDIFHISCGSSFVPSLKGHGPLLGTQGPTENGSGERRCLSVLGISSALKVRGYSLIWSFLHSWQAVSRSLLDPCYRYEYITY